MDTTTRDVQAGDVTYGKDDVFDLVAGVPVYGPSGSEFGTVTEVAGFGSTYVGAEPAPSSDRVTQAQSGTGFFKVQRKGAAGDPDVCIPFHAIQEVTEQGAVILTAAYSASQDSTRDATGSGRDIARSGLIERWTSWFTKRTAR